MAAMRLISAKEYKAIRKRQGRDVSLGHVYAMMESGKIPWQPVEVTKRLKKIPWDDTRGEPVKLS